MLVNMLIAGFGGQGVLFSGKIIAYTGLIEKKNVSWLPSYGPEMRGGTANCSVCIDTAEIGCPIVLEPDTLVAMNRPSYDKFIGDVNTGGVVVYDSSLIDIDKEREDITSVAIPASSMAVENELDGLANIIILGATLKATNFTDFEVVCDAIEQCVPASKKHLLEPNKRALKLGYDFVN